MTKKQTKSNWRNIVSLSITSVGILLAMSCSSRKSPTDSGSAANNKISASNQSPTLASKPKPTPNHSKDYPPTPGFEKFEILDTGKFNQTKASSFFDKTMGYLKNVTYTYVYADGRFDKVHSYDTDVQLQIWEYASPEKAQARFKLMHDKDIPAQQADKVKLPRCVGNKSDSDDFVGPDKIVKRLRHPNGSEIIVSHSGDFNMYDCKRGSNQTEYVNWVDGSYVFAVNASPFSGVKDGEPGSTGHSRAEEFALNYLAALGQPVPQ